MRLILTMRGTPVVDLELRWPHSQADGDGGPTLQAAPHLAGSEIAAPMTQPDTAVCTARTFGFGRPA